MSNRARVTVLTLMLTGCSVEGEDSVDAYDERTDEIVDNLMMAGYPPEEIEVREDGTVLVGGDAEVSLEASREMLGSQDDGITDFRQYRTFNLVAPWVSVICVDGSAFAGTLSTGLDNAIANFNDLDLSFTMVRTTGSNAGCSAEIVGSVVGGSGGSAGFPSGGLPYGSIQIGSGMANYGVAVTTHVITHELGHCVGFRHTDYFDRSISCGTGGNEGGGGYGAVHVPGTPTGAVFNGSLMNSCYNGGSMGVFSIDDFTAVNELYANGSRLRGIHRSYNPASHEHFYTTNVHEAQCCGFALESSNSFYLEEDGGSGRTPFYRCFKANGKHFYTQSPTCEGSTVEGTLGFIRTGPGVAGTTALYRLYSGAFGDHLYTTSAPERDYALSVGYTYEGVAGYVWAP